MKLRVISAVILLPFVILLLLFGGLPLTIVLCCATIIGLYEFFKAVKMYDLLLKLLSVVLVVTVYSLFWTNHTSLLNMTILIFVVLCLGVYVMRYPRITIEHLGYVMFGIVYIVYLLIHIALVRSADPNGIWMVWLIFVIAFGSDSAAYFVGVNFGKHKLVPNLSPKKTIEGAFGGILGAGLLSGIFGFVVYQLGYMDDFTSILIMFFIGAFGSVISQVGDLVGSAMKRQTQIKDFGKLIPGHGGIIDRLDSVLLTAPYVYLVMTLI